MMYTYVFHDIYVRVCIMYIDIFMYVHLPKTKKFGCVGRGDLTSLFFSKVAK